MASVLIAIAGCAQVNPAPDFRRVADSAAERLGVEQMYDPAADALVDAKVATLMDGGLTVDKVVQIALLNNRGFQAQFAILGASRADVVQSGLFSNPSISLLARFPEGGGRSNLQFGLAQDIVDLWQIPVRKRIAQAELEQTILAVLHRAIELAADVRNRYYALLGLQRSEQISRENLLLAERSLTLAQQRLDAGAASRLDVNLVRGRVLDVRQSLITLERDRGVAEAALAEILGLARIDTSLTDSLPEPSATTYDEGTLLELALTQRFDSRMMDAQIDAAEDQLAREYLRVFPSVSLSFELERTDRRALPGRKILADTARSSIAAGQLTAPTIESRAQRNLARRQIIDSLMGPGIQFTLPLWDQNQAQIAKARYGVLRVRKEAADIQRTITRQVHEALIRQRTAVELVRFYEHEAIPLANENLDTARGLYQTGEQSVLFLIDAQEALIQQRRAYVDAVRDGALARSELERAIGGRLALVPTTQPITTQPVSPSGD